MKDKKMLIPLARDFALRAHEKLITTTVGGLRRPNILHLQEVANLVWASGGTDEEIAAAWLHDAVEDTTATLAIVRRKFGNRVAHIVDGLTDPKGLNKFPLPERKRRQAIRLKSEGASVRRIKIADQTSNIRSLGLDPTDAMTPVECRDYIEGAKLLARACRGVSPLLDKMFAVAYKKGMARYRSAKQRIE